MIFTSWIEPTKSELGPRELKHAFGLRKALNELHPECLLNLVIKFLLFSQVCMIFLPEVESNLAQASLDR